MFLIFALMIHSFSFNMIRHSIWFLFIFSFVVCYGQRNSRGNVDAAFGAPAKFVDFRLPTCLEVARHFLWRFETMKSQSSGRVTHRAVATEVHKHIANRA